jgi:hypothetical protein
MKHLILLLPLLACDDQTVDVDNTGSATDPTVPTAPTTTQSPTGSTTDGTGTTASACDMTVVFLAPEHMETDVDYRTRMLMGLVPSPAAADLLRVTHEDGTVLAGTTSVTDEGLEFVPDQFLRSEITYTMSVAGCPLLTSTFTTGELGDPVDPLFVVDQSYALDLATGQWIAPAGFGALLPTVGLTELLVGVASADAAQITTIGAVADAAGAQAMCIETVDFPSADFTDNPYFSIGPVDANLFAAGLAADLFDIVVVGDFLADGSEIRNGSLEGLLDVGVFSGLLGDVCGLAATLGATCVACPSGLSQACIAIRVEDLTAAGRLPMVVPVIQDDIGLDPNCQN